MEIKQDPQNVTLAKADILYSHIFLEIFCMGILEQNWSSLAIRSYKYNAN